MKRRIALLLVVAMLAVLCVGCGTAQVSEPTAKEKLDAMTMMTPYLDKAESMESKTVPFYLMKAENKSDVTLHYFNGQDDIPYLDADTAAQILRDLAGYCDQEGYALEVTKNEGSKAVCLNRENGTSATLSPSDNTISFTNWEGFLVGSGAANGLDVITTQGTEAEPYLLKHTSGVYKEGGVALFTLSDYQIGLVDWEDACYIPVQTFADLFLAFSGRLLCNGESLILTDEALIGVPEIPTMTPEGDGDFLMEKSPLGEVYYSVEPREKSEALAQYTYNELCFALDQLYGLKPEHGIDSFDELFIRTGLVDQLRNTDPNETAKGLSVLAIGYFNDGHSAFGEKSAWIQQSFTFTEYVESMVEGKEANANMIDLVIGSVKYKAARAKAVSGGESLGQLAQNPFMGYEEVGNTAYITFDQFVIDREKDYYAAEPTNDASDTVNLLLYANRQLHREGCPIENVVIDLTCNGGGDADAAMCVAAWFLGSSRFNLKSTLSEAQGTTYYQFDANLDRQFDSGTDSVAGKHLYCLISPGSFSCGNLIPSAFRESDSVTLIGRPTGGGACVVNPMTSADGNLFQISGPLQVSSVTNGSFYNVDQGVTPNVYIDDIGNFYNRQYMTDLINTLP